MKTKGTTACLLIGLTVLLGAAAFAQDGKLTADIPFSFYVGQAKMASGQYTVRAINANALLIGSIDDTKSAVSLSNAAITPRDLHNGRLVFRHYGSEYFLSEVSWPGGPSRVLPQTSLEIEVAKKVGTPQKLDVATK